MAECLNCGILFIKRKNTFGKYCSHTCRGQHLKIKSYQKFLNGDLSDRTTIYHCLLKRDGVVCSTEGCNVSIWLNNPIRLQVDHINGNPADNSPENLRLLCPNCHSQTPFFGAKNKGNGRKSRGLPIK